MSVTPAQHGGYSAAAAGGSGADCSAWAAGERPNAFEVHGLLRQSQRSTPPSSNRASPAAAPVPPMPAPHTAGGGKSATPDKKAGSPPAVGGGKACNHDKFCMDMTCRFSHDEGRNICLAGSECKARLCPWVHPARGFEKKLVGAAAELAAGADQSKLATAILVGRMLKARRGAQAAFARASDARLEASNAAAAAVEQARCVEIIEQISAFDAFSSAPLDELLDGVADKRRGGELARRLNREIYRLEDAPKPALARREAIMQLLERPDCDSLVVRGDTGSGKSTQLPQYIAELVVEKNAAARRRALALDKQPEKDRKVLCTQPRKVAAVSVVK